ncbi:hypothetical protein [Luteimonas sp. 3794]|uniref:hypothetical protein n=1 Tax=Luteimonas sp. 3794 TaxID=2817730 RepID=UPI0028598EF8|nr:hypothetical protein [Luteimonas sp. 3794]MDR6992468.1 hypothetical protein [Luteimonas sp. 3794]
MAELKNFDIVGSFQRGQQIGTQQRLVKDGEQRRNMLAELAGQAYGAPAEQRQGLVQKAIATDPEAGFALNKGLEYDDDRRSRTMVNMSKMLISVPEQARPMLYQRMAAEFPAMGMQGFPTEYTPETKQLIDGTAQSIVQAYSGANGEAPSQQRYAEWLLNQVPEGDREQALGVLAGTRARPATGGYGFDEIEGADGRKRLRRTNPRSGVLEIYDEQTGEFVPFGGAPSAPGAAAPGSQAPAPGLYNTPNGPARIGENLSPGDWELIQADMANNGAADAYELPTRNLTPAQFRGANPALGVSRAPEEQAAATEAAKLGTELGFMPRQQEIETQGAVERTRQEAAVKADAETAALDATRSRDATGTLDLLDAAEKLLGGATGSGAGAATDRAAGFFGVSTPGAQNTAGLRTIAGQLTSKMPRMQGPQSDKDVQLYKEMAGDLANDQLPVPTRLASLRTIRELNEKYADQQAGVAGQAQDAPPVRISGAADYEALPSGTLFIAPDGSRRRKR